MALHASAAPFFLRNFMIQESMQLHGAMTLLISRANGDTETVYQDNLIVNVGFDFIADAIGKSASRPSVMGYIALGTGTGN